jgi:hypothetical protein
VTKNSSPPGCDEQFTDVSEEHTAFTFKVENMSSWVYILVRVLDLLFNSEDRGNTLLRNVSKILLDYTVLHNKLNSVAVVSKRTIPT